MSEALRAKMTQLERRVLEAVKKLNGLAEPAYGLTINYEIVRATRASYSIPDIYDALDRLEEAGLARHEWTEPQASRNGARKQLWFVVDVPEGEVL